MAALFWVGGSTAYDGTTNRLATSTGGTATVAVISAADTVTFDGLSPAGAVVTTSAAISCTTLNLATGFTGSLTMSNTLTVSGTCTLTQGGLDLTGQTATMGVLTNTGAATRALNLTNTTLNITGTTGAILAFTTGGLTLTTTGSTVNFTDTGASAKSITFNSVTMNNVSFTGGGAGVITFNSTTTLNTLTIGAPKTIAVKSGATKTVTSLVAIGAPGKLITLQSDIAGATWTISQASGTINAYYLSLSDSVATGGAQFNAFESASVGHNSGWTIVGGPSVMNNQQFVKVGDGMSTGERIR